MYFCIIDLEFVGVLPYFFIYKFGEFYFSFFGKWR
uniref:Uncharacterized protein n=1 Tax=Borreliella burgdorferi TaxID=139 RepID=Q6W6N6_BORBG|nr:hypothetical protein [Borreliella burgdorferi]